MHINASLQAREIPGVKIFQYGGPLHFANAEFFRTELIRKCGTEYGILYNQVKFEALSETCKLDNSLHFSVHQLTCYFP